VAFVNSTSNVSWGTGTTVSAPAFVATAGNLIAVILGTYDATAVVADVTDTAGNAYVRARLDTQSTAGSIDIWYAKNVIGHASNVVVATFSSAVANARKIITHQYSNRHLTAPLLAGATGVTSFGTSVTSGSFDPGVAGADEVAGVNTQGGETSPVAGTGYTLRENNTDIRSEDQVNAPAGTQTASMSWTTDTAAILSVVAFAAAAATVKSESGSPVVVFLPAGAPSVVGTMQIVGTPRASFSLAGVPAVAAIVLLGGTIAVVTRATSELVVPRLEVLWGVPVNFYTTFRDLVFLGRREYGVYLENRGSLALALPTLGELRVISAHQEITGAVRLIARLVGAPNLLTQKAIAGHPTMLVQAGGSPIVVAGGGGSSAGTGTTFAPQYVNVTGGGAMPNWAAGFTTTATGDGNTDDTNQLQTDLNTAAAQGKALILPATNAFYRITSALTVNTSVTSGVTSFGAVATIRQTTISSSAAYSIFRVAAGATCWIYNLRLQGAQIVGGGRGEYAHCINLGGVNGVTIKGCLLEYPMGDCIADNAQENDGAATARNVLVDGNTFLNWGRCMVSLVNVSDRWAMMNNLATDDVAYVSPVDLEPWHAASLITNIEVGYNKIVTPANSYETSIGNYVGVVTCSGWFDPNPGFNIYVHNNYGDWPFSNFVTLSSNAGSFTNVQQASNVRGNTVP